MDEEWYTEPDPARWHLMKEKLTISAALILFVVVFCMVALRLYVRWYVLSHLERSGMLNNGMLYGEDNPPGTTVDRGLDPEVLNSLPVFRYSVFKTKEQCTQECTVCLSEFEENDRVRLLPKCNHSFHVDCIDTWLHSHSTCPVCRSKVEAVVKPAGLAEPVVEVCGSGPGSSSEVANMTSLEVTSKHVDGLVGPSTEVSQSQSDCELTQSSSHQLSSFKRLLRKTSIDGGRMTPGASRGPGELDLESGPRESTEIRRPGE